jgi:hypothetical protein
MSNAVAVSRHLRAEAGQLAGQLGRLLESAFPHVQGTLEAGLNFLAQAHSASLEPLPHVEDLPLDRLARGLRLDPIDRQILLLTGLPEEHEGFAAIFRSLHPRGESRPSLALAAQLLAPSADERVSLRQRLETGPLTQSGAVHLTGDGPFFERSLALAPALWPALAGIDAWPSHPRRLDRRVVHSGLAAWLAQPDSMRARRALERREPLTIMVAAEMPDTALDRALALVDAAGATAISIDWTGDPAHEALLVLHALVRGDVPVIRVAPAEAPGAMPSPTFLRFAGTAILCGRPGMVDVPHGRPIVPVDAGPLAMDARGQSWAHQIPALATEASWLAARFPLEPAYVSAVAGDLRAVESLDGRAPTLEDAAGSIRARNARALSAGVRLIVPKAGWSSIVLPRDRVAQLQEAVSRLEGQMQVLDRWRFLADRTGSRGVRMLFAGPPGTGKTLAAEVVAKELKADLLLVDIARVVSKWIGETERNLAQVFDSAEQTRAVLFFDEADALFGRRTEVSDAHDRYANLETAYLLSRLERFDGLAILASNLRSNIDPAFIRRLEFVVDFQDPDREDRARLWSTHIPAGTPLAADVNLYEFAASYPIVGAVIRNAATAAAFLAARDGLPIDDREH